MSKRLAAFYALAFGLWLAVGSGAPVLAATPGPPSCSTTSTGNTAITDLGARTYQGEQGGLYPGGSNVPPSTYRAAGIQAGRAVVPVDASGKANAAGHIVFMSIGMSNTSMEFHAFYGSERSDSQLNPAVAMVDGAQFGMSAPEWSSPSDTTWAVADQRLAAAGYTNQQVEVVWLKQTIKQLDITPTTGFETYAHQLQTELAQITSIAAQRYPNLRQVFVTPRTYAGYAGGQGPNPEPYAYETAFGDKWFVAQWVANPALRPWVGWGPYLWTDGTRGRADGLKWYCADTIDGTHPSSSGLAKVNTYMHSLFVNSVFTPWFTGSTPAQPPGPSPVPVRSPIPTPVATPTVPPGAAHPATPRPGATQPAQSPVANIPKTSGNAGQISQAIAALSSLPTTQGWSPTAIAIVLIAGLITAFALLVMGRRWRLPRRPLRKPINGGGANGSGPLTESPAASEPPDLVGVGTGERGSQEGGQPPTQ